MNSVLVFDPGESTGWVYLNSPVLLGGTLGKNHGDVARLIRHYAPAVVVLERFNLYPGMARSMSWNSFYPVEVIGVIKYVCDDMSIPVIEQAPSVKKYAGSFDAGWDDLREQSKHSGLCLAITEHTKDAYLHLKYYLSRAKAKGKKGV